MFKKLLCIVLSIMMLLGATVVAGCVPNFTVTFDANGGYFVDPALQVQVVASAEEIEIPTVKREGYKFDGWDKVVSKIKKDTTVKANWTKRATFEVTFRANGGTLLTGVETQKVADASEIVAPVYERTGYTLSWDIDFTNIIDDTIINAVWVPVKYKLNFVAGPFENWGTFTENSFIEIDYGSIVSGENFPEPTYSDISNPDNIIEKKFGGWVVTNNEDYEGQKFYVGNTWYFLTDMYIKPIWIDVVDCVITYNLNGGEFGDNGGINSFKSTDKDFSLNNPVRKGYDFIGWIGEGYTEPTMNVVIKEGTQTDLFFTACWRERYLTVELDANGGTVDQKNLTFMYGQLVGELPIPEKEGYVFTGWAGDGYFFHGGDNGQTIWEIDKPTVLVAQYLRVFTVKFVLKYQYVERWMDKDSGTSRQKTHKITFNYNGESKIPDTTILEGEEISTILEQYSTSNIIPDLIKGEMEYKFTGRWVYVVDGSSNPTTDNTMPINDSTLAIESRAVDGVITIAPVGQSLFYGPY